MADFIIAGDMNNPEWLERLTWKDVRAVHFGDAGHESRGDITGCAEPCILPGDEAKMSIIDWRSGPTPQRANVSTKQRTADGEHAFCGRSSTGRKSQECGAAGCINGVTVGD